MRDTPIEGGRAQCPGSAVNPLAAPGHLCVYESVSQNRGSVVLLSGTTGAVNQASKWGAAADGGGLRALVVVL